MVLARTAILACSAAFWGFGTFCGLAYGQLPASRVSDSGSTGIEHSLDRLDQALCLQQWDQAIAITSQLMASPVISSDYRHELLSFRQQLQRWRLSQTPPTTVESCDRTLPFFLVLEPPAPPTPQPLDWGRALASLGNPRPVIEFARSSDEASQIIPAELLDDSPSVLAQWSTPVDTSDGFSVLGGRLGPEPQAYSFLARLGDRISLDVDITRVESGMDDSQLFLFDQQGQLVAKNDDDGLGLQSSIQNFVVPKTDVYFVVVSGSGILPVLDGNRLAGWRSTTDVRFDYTLTLTGVTPYQTLLQP